jgi:hypothetical protein
MYKLLIVALAVSVAVAQASSLAGGINPSSNTDKVMDVARWAMSSISQYTGIQGSHTVMTVRNVKTQVVAGMRYVFTVDVLAQDENNKYFVRNI